jgi:hypothetical protein
MRRAYLMFTGLLAVTAAPVFARVSPVTDRAGSQLITDVTACRAITDSAARLACYDGSVAKLADASDKKDVVVLDREEVQKTKRSLFGFELPHLPFFDNAGDSKDKKASQEFTQIEAKITSARQNAAGDWILDLDDNSVWQTTEAPKNDPRSNESIRIRKAAMGSYFGNIAGDRATRMRRIR